MNRFLILIALIIFSYHFCFSQNYNFYIGGSYPYFNSKEYTSESIGSILSPIPGSDSLYIQQRVNRINTYKNEYSVNPGITAGVRARWDLKERIFIESGLGISSFNFTSDSKFIGSESTPIGQPDTVVFNPNPSTGSSCDYYTNELSSLSNQVNYDPQYHSLDLHVPFQLGYFIIPEKLDFVFGAVLRTPLAVIKKREFITQDRVTDEADLTACTYRIETEKDKTGGDFRDLTISAQLEISYWLNNFGISAAVNKMFSNIFSESEERDFFSNDNGILNPILFSLNIKYKLNQKKPKDYSLSFF